MQVSGTPAKARNELQNLNLEDLFPLGNGLFFLAGIQEKQDQCQLLEADNQTNLRHHAQ